MHRAFIHFIAAGALAITSIGLSTAPARADGDDTARALAAILGLAIVGAAIHDSTKDKGYVRRDHHGHKPKVRVHVNKNHHYVTRNDRYYEDVKPRKRHNHRLLPGNCLRTWHTRDGRMRVFGQRCLQRNYHHVNALPDRCFRRVNTKDGRRHGYAARCLNRHGYQLAHR